MDGNWLIVLLVAVGALAAVVVAVGVCFLLASLAFALYVYCFVERSEEGVANLSLPSIGRLLLRTGFGILSVCRLVFSWVGAVFIVLGMSLLNRLPRATSSEES